MRLLLESTSATNGGRAIARHSLVVAACLFIAASALPAAAIGQEVSVREEAGTYTVAATFAVPQPPSIAIAALTDYNEIPRFMPDVRTSNVIERTNDRAVVEQEATARFMMFSKRVHLVLEVQEDQHRIRFRDRCKKSFALYEGEWTFEEARGVTTITYGLSAKPSFEVPDFLLKRLLKRDAAQMIERLKVEIAARGARVP
jgi:ribosome-associated toxin RatA of RatAB toxin-antitoxin module